MKTNKLSQQKADLKTVSNFNEVAKANVIHKPTTNVSEPTVNVLQSTKKDYYTKVAKKEKSLSETPKPQAGGIPYFKASTNPSS